MRLYFRADVGIKAHTEPCLVLARSTEPIDTLPSPPNEMSIEPTSFNDELDLEEHIDGSIPRGSIPILDEKEEKEEDRDNDDDESLRTAPLRLLSPQAKKAVEKARRKNYAKPVGRLSRGSLGDISLSDRFDDMNNLNLKIATESSFGDRIYDRRFSDHNEVIQKDMGSRLEPRLGYTIQESGPRTLKFAVSIRSTCTIRCLKIRALVNLLPKTIYRGISLMRQ